jgi:hypothetical protein
MAFLSLLLDKWRKPLKDLGHDPLGEKPSEEIGKKKLASLMIDGGPEAAGVVQSAVEEFAQQLTTVIRRFLKLKDWRGRRLPRQPDRRAGDRAKRSATEGGWRQPRS